MTRRATSVVSLSPSAVRNAATRSRPPAALARIVAAVFVLVAAGAARADYIDHLAALDDVGKMKVPRRGAPTLLVIPVVVEDQPFEGGVDEDAWLAANLAFFAGGDDAVAAGEPFDFPSFWARQSLGVYAPVAHVTAPVRFATCPPLGPHDDCAVPRGGGLTDGDLVNAAATIRDSLALFDEIVRCALYGPNEEARCSAGDVVDPATFDQLGPDDAPDGFMDGVVVVSNAPFPGIALPVKDLSENTILLSAGPLPRFSYDGVVVGAVAVSGRESGAQKGRWVAVHEHGHLLGFCDLYDESGQTTDLPYTTMGGWFYATPPSLLDPFSRAAIGWARLQQVDGPGTYALTPAWRTGHALVVGTGDELFLVELRVKRADVDGDLGVDHGVAVFRARFSERPSAGEGGYLGTLADCVNCAPFDGMLMLEEADGAYDLQFGRARSDAEDLFQAGDSIGPSDDTTRRSLNHPVSSTNLLSGAPTGITITVDAVSADGATLTIDAPVVDDACAALTEALCREQPCGDQDGVVICGPPSPDPPPPDDALPPPTCAGCGGDPASAAALVVAASLLGRRRRR